jgi:hypothetical protein
MPLVFGQRVEQMGLIPDQSAVEHSRQHIQAGAGECDGLEEVDRDDRLGLKGQERCPGGGGG